MPSALPLPTVPADSKTQHKLLGTGTAPLAFFAAFTTGQGFELLSLRRAAAEALAWIYSHCTLNCLYAHLALPAATAKPRL